MRRCWSGLLRSESGGLYLPPSWTAAVALSGSGDSVPEAGAGDVSGNSFRATRAITFSRPGGLIEGAERSDLEVCVGLALAGHAVGIAESAGLNFADRGIHGHSCGTAELTGVDYEIGTRAAGLQNRGLKLRDGCHSRRCDVGRRFTRDAHLFRYGKFWFVEHRRGNWRRQLLGDHLLARRFVRLGLQIDRDPTLDVVLRQLNFLRKQQTDIDDQQDDNNY